MPTYRDADMLTLRDAEHARLNDPPSDLARVWACAVGYVG